MLVATCLLGLAAPGVRGQAPPNFRAIRVGGLFADNEQRPIRASFGALFELTTIKHNFECAWKLEAVLRRPSFMSFDMSPHVICLSASINIPFGYWR